MIHLTRRYRFSASHRLHVATLDDQENRRLYGKCNNPFGHGHNYELEISVCGPVNPWSGQVADVDRLDALMREQVLEPFDHKYLNTQLDPFDSVAPTSENIGWELCRRLKRNWASAFAGDWPRLEKVRIAETPRNIFEVSADEVE